MMTCSQIRCLLAILALSRMREEVASKDIAHLLGISKPSVHRLLESLGRADYIDKKPYGSIRLTEAGEVLALALEERRERLVLVFARTFALSSDECSMAATLLMSGLKEESLKAMEAQAELSGEKR